MTVNRIVGFILILIVASVIVAGVLAPHGGGSPAAPRVGDQCTRHGSTFTYNDGGPGFVEQTAFGLTCQ